MNLQLRNYQKELIKKIYTRWPQGDRRVMAQCPTGGGKLRPAIRKLSQAGLTRLLIMVGLLAEAK